MNIEKYIMFVAFASIIFLTGADGVLAGNVILWDTMIFEDGHANAAHGNALKWESMSESLGWGNRANWYQVPYGTTGAYHCVGSCVLENGNIIAMFPLGYKNNVTHEAAQPLIAGLINGAPGESPAFYGKNIHIFPPYTLDQWWDYYPELYANPYTIIKNQADEIIVNREAGLISGANIARYRLKANTGWIERAPLTVGTYPLALHDSPNKYAIAPPIDISSNDFVVDKAVVGADGLFHQIFFGRDGTHNYGLYQLLSEHNNRYSMMVIPKDVPSADPYIIVDTATEASTPYTRLTSVTALTAMNIANNITYFGVVNYQNTFNHQSSTQSVNVGQTVTASYNYPIAGQWRISGRIGSTYYTQTKDVSAGTQVSFTAPVSGILYNLTWYLYDRNSQTPADVNTPQDIYRSITGDTQPSPTPTPTPTPTSPPSPTPTPTQPPLPSNPTNIENPGFESGTTPWLFHTNGTGTFTAAPPGFEGTNAAKITLSSSGTNIQLYQTGITLEPGTRYRLSFAAYSNTGHNLTVYLHKHLTPYTNYGLSYTAALNSTWQTFTTEFTTTGFSGTVNDGRLRFWFASFAAAGDIYYIDDVRLEKVDISNNIYDLNNDGVVNVNDLEIVALHFGENTVATYPNYDVNAEGKVDILDITLVSNNIV